jgi:hypothetical protein
MVAALVTCAAAASSPGRVILPVIYAQDGAAALAMRSAPVILLVKVTALKLTGDKRMVGKPPEVGGPMTPTIPLHLARIRADVLLTIRGPVLGNVEFYSWVWASGKHGGPRLFHPSQGSIHVVFLRTENRYLHTVGDYPSYDLELSSRWLPALLSAWNSSRNGDADPLERLVRLRLDAEFGGLSANDVRAEASRDYYLFDLPDLVRLFGPFFVATQLDDICRHSGNQFGRLAACDVTGREFPGRCQAYQLAPNSTPEGMESVLTKAFKRCEAETQELILRLRSNDLPQRGFYGWSLTPEHRRGAMRLYASAMDPEFQNAACEVAATMPEARDIPECAGPRPR